MDIKLQGRRVVARGLAVLVGALLMVRASTTFGSPSPSASEDDAPAEGAQRRSPRETVQKFLELARAGRFQECGALLEVSKATVAERERLARRLKAVLDRHLRLDLDKISDAEAGATNDGLPPNLEQIGRIPSPDPGMNAVRLHHDSQTGVWLFSRATVSRIDSWYEKLDNRWLLENLPSPLLRAGPLDVLWWQWLGFSLLIPAALVLGRVSSAVVQRVLSSAAAKTATLWDDRLLASSKGPLLLAFALGYTRLLLPWLSLSVPAEDFVDRALRGLFLADLLWTFWRFVDVGAELAWKSEWSHEHPGSRALIPLGRRAGKAVVAMAAIILFLSVLGYPVTSLLAGLGIGGLALALASQKTVENLFGAFSLGIDQPFREGDFVRIDDLAGTVESLGLRSTKIRTLDRTVVSIPNGKLAEMRLETFAVRDRLRLACCIGLVYETTEEQMRAVLAGFEGVLREHPKIWPDVVMVRFKELGASSLDIDVMAWFATNDGNEFLLIRQEVLLAFMRVVERAGTGFAFPTQTVHVARQA